jgi:hypothetical protein
MNKRAFVTVLLLTAFTLISTTVAVVHVISERSITMARVREADFQIISMLLKASQLQDVASVDTEKLHQAFRKLGSSRGNPPRVGLVLKLDGRTVASNLGKSSVDQLIADYDLPEDALERIDLGNGWLLTGVLIDRKYFRKRNRYGYLYWSDWHWNFSVPYQQLIDERDISWGVIARKAEGALFATLALGFVVILIWVIWWFYVQQKIRILEQKNNEASLRIDNLEHALDEEHSEKLRSEAEIESKRIELQKVENQLGTSEHNREEAEARRKELKADLDFWEAESQKSDQKVTSLSRQLDREHKEKLSLENKLQKLQKPGKSDCGKLLIRIWNLEWHPEAEKEALKFFTRRGQPAERRHLSELLSEVSQLKNQVPDANKWSPFKNKSGISVWHNGGRQQAKLYWTRLNSKPVVIAVASGNDDHQAFDGGESLHQRVSSLVKKQKQAA